MQLNELTANEDGSQCPSNCNKANVHSFLTTIFVNFQDQIRNIRSNYRLLVNAKVRRMLSIVK